MPNSNPSKDCRPAAVIFSQGDEVINGATVDTNAAWLAEHCQELGFNIIRHITVADDLDDIVHAMQEIDGFADVCLSTGGLGSTQDDLTMQAYSLAFGVELEFNENALNAMTAYFKGMNRPMPDVNRKQAYVPADTRIIDNHWGTAPGFMGKAKRCLFYFMPGVPYEMKKMVESFVKEDLRKMFKVNKQKLVTLRTTGLGESAIQQKLDEFAIPKNVRISFRAGLAENELKLYFSDTALDVEIELLVEQIKTALGRGVFAVDGLGQSVKSLPDLVDQLMQEKGLSLQVVETLTQGKISQQCSSTWLKNTKIYPRVADVLAELNISGDEINEEIATQCAAYYMGKGTSKLVLVQLYDVVSDSEGVIFTALVGKDISESSTKKIKGRLELQRVSAMASAFERMRVVLEQ
ncbi:MAG: hypothetical protein A6F71_00565 [Cycloclasticus sp. symbiont of Poecilosclerida sp. M]|nr:MAG: hypothetical protein A6F71_00565 [Cycloclasticus sp. symbiont of Poecilosclerida sp. M]